MDLSDVDNKYVAKSREIFGPKGLRLLLRQGRGRRDCYLSMC